MATGGAFPVTTINGPTVTAIGWIPYQPLFGSRLPAAYAQCLSHKWVYAALR